MRLSHSLLQALSTRFAFHLDLDLQTEQSVLSLFKRFSARFDETANENRYERNTHFAQIKLDQVFQLVQTLIAPINHRDEVVAAEPGDARDNGIDLQTAIDLPRFRVSNNFKDVFIEDRFKSLSKNKNYNIKSFSEWTDIVGGVEGIVKNSSGNYLNCYDVRRNSQASGFF